MLGIAILFVTDFRFKKPTNKVIAVLVAVVTLAIIYMFSGYWLAWRNL